jgi:hypothetical protein
VIVVYYVTANGDSATWYPNTAAPTVAPSTVITIRMRAPAVLDAPGTLLH